MMKSNLRIRSKALTHNPELAKFFSRIRPLQQLWPWVEVRYIAFQEGRTCFNFVSTLTLKHITSESDSRGNSEKRIGSFRFGRKLAASKETDYLMYRLAEGRIPYIQPSVWLTNHSGSKSATPNGSSKASDMKWTTWELVREQEGSAFWNRDPSAAFLLNGEVAMGSLMHRAYEAWNKFEESLLRQDEPYLSTKDFMQNFLGVKDAWNFGAGQSKVFMIANLPGEFDQGLSINESPIHIGVRCPVGLSARDYSVASVMDFGPDRHLMRRQKLRLERKGTPLGTDSIAYSAFIDEPNGHRLSLRLLLRGVQVDSLDILLPAGLRENPRVSAFDFFDPGLDQIRKILVDPQSQASSGRSQPDQVFEAAVGWLFGIGGFQTIHIGTKSYKLTNDEIDWLAFVPDSKSLITVEVTTGAAQQQGEGKMGKLRTRTDAVQERLPEYTLLPVLVTPKQLCDADVSAGDGFGIVVAGPATIAELLDMVVDKSTPKQIFEYLSGYLKKKDVAVI